MTIKRRRVCRGNPKLAVALIRVSTDDQRLGPEAQRAAILAWAAREETNVVAWHIEQGISGGAAVENRPGLLTALNALKEWKAGVLIVAKRDRLARDVMNAAMIERLASRSGAVVCAADGTNAEGPEGVMMRGIIDVFAQYERLLIGARTRAALDSKRARGERTGGIPFGFRLDEDARTLVRDDAEQVIIAHVVKMRRAGLSIRKVVEACEKQGLQARTGRPLGKAQVERILSRWNVPSVNRIAA